MSLAKRHEMRKKSGTVGRSNVKKVANLADQDKRFEIKGLTRSILVRQLADQIGINLADRNYLADFGGLGP